ncbi:4-(cytidine 5'-diphospho)-2-C-methyl-D-erythritol kinase [Sphingomonas phyllosphaerae]|uniref:4-(cytidine 5'-diphospho)-2-C-methyl-D-erythritol kinase n=1 Tax=Sphingomonas phyllosphaerae TaxID=257003 RepID=UPI00048DDF2B|nr:4-(cytidine 5'-diphospho)-2-C-methyl-D-erythritol kinase [Sphingomonas phyllosphaerae]
MIAETAPAKLNLALHVRARRADGYHELETLFVFARDGDRVTVAPATTRSFAVTGPFAEAVGPAADNLVTRAEAAFRQAFVPDAIHAVTLDKHLPVASGIGGGSADAAATLRALARLHGLPVDTPRLLTIAADLGADVPACLLGRPTFGRGRGDALAPIAGLGDMPALLVNPGVAVSTAQVFAHWDGVDRGALDLTGTTLERARAGRNDLQPPAEAIAPVIGAVISGLAASPGAVLTRMSGSGATCFALFDDAATRDSAAAAIANAAPAWWLCPTTIS